jgi:hypothetical protein
MLVIVDKNTDAVVDIVNTATEVENGIMVNEGEPTAVIYAPAGGYHIFEVETIPDGVKPYQYCYNTDQGFYVNPDFTPYVSPEEKVKQLEAQIKTLAETVDFLLGV